MLVLTPWIQQCSLVKILKFQNSQHKRNTSLESVLCIFCLFGEGKVSITTKKMQNPINFRSAGTMNQAQSSSAGSSSGSGGNGANNNNTTTTTTSAGTQKKQHKYPKRLSQNMEKRAEGSAGASSSRPTTSSLSKTRVEEMYNSRTNQDRDTRNASPIIPLRNFNNWVKGVLIYKYVPMQSVVLDISCGKGGDLFKYHFRNIKYYVGVDIAHASLVDCTSRYNENSAQFKFPITLIHADVGKVSHGTK